MSLTIIEADERILSVMSIDFSSFKQENSDTYVNSNLLSPSGRNDGINYLLLNPVYLNKSYSRTGIPLYFKDAEWNMTQISELLNSTVYENDDFDEIKSTMKKKSFKDIDGNMQKYAEFKVEGKTKNMFFSPWYLKMRPRDDRTKEVVGDVFCLITTDEKLNRQRNEIEEDVYRYAVTLSILFVLFICIFGFIFSNWISNKYSGYIMKQISEASKTL